MQILMDLQYIVHLSICNRFSARFFFVFYEFYLYSILLVVRSI